MQEVKDVEEDEVNQGRGFGGQPQAINATQILGKQETSYGPINFVSPKFLG